MLGSAFDRQAPVHVTRLTRMSRSGKERPTPESVRYLGSEISRCQEPFLKNPNFFSVLQIRTRGRVPLTHHGQEFFGTALTTPSQLSTITAFPASTGLAGSAFEKQAPPAQAVFCRHPFPQPSDCKVDSPLFFDFHGLASPSIDSAYLIVLGIPVSAEPPITFFNSPWCHLTVIL